MSLAQHLIEHAALGIDGKPLVGWDYKGDLASTAALPATGGTSEAYTIDGHVWAWNGSAWVDIGSITGPAGDPGAPGEPGEPGDPGEPGPAAEITSGAIADALGYTPASAATAVVSTSIRTVVTLTQAAYDALTPAADTLYVITD
jgi:hypothetical protein